MSNQKKNAQTGAGCISKIRLALINLYHPGQKHAKFTVDPFEVVTRFSLWQSPPVPTDGCALEACLMTGPGCCESELDKLVQRINQVAAGAGDPLGDLVQTVQGMIQGEIDPYLLAGVLVEGAAQAVRLRVPPERRTVVSVALLQLLRDRLSATEEDTQPPP
ncbi:MAG TPA: hypothetical protein VGG99_07345 [Acetobacteraceae bacterium]